MKRKKIIIKPRGTSESKKPALKAPLDESLTSSSAQHKPVSKKKYAVLFGVGIILVLIAFWFITGPDDSRTRENRKTTNQDHPELSNHEIRDLIFSEEGVFVNPVLNKLNIKSRNRGRILRAYHNILEGNRLPAGKYTIYASDVNPDVDQFLVIEPDPPVRQYIIQLTEPFSTWVVDKNIETRLQETSCLLKSSDLYKEIRDAGLPHDILEKLEDAFAWTIDLHHIHAGDRFKVIYEENFLDEKSIGIKRIYCFLFEIKGTPFYAFGLNDRRLGEKYLNEKALSMKRRFLKAPVKFTRISSPFGERIHPSTGNIQQHKGIDYAAPLGTPINALADGEVTISTFKQFNGNYVKIKHDALYQSQYLHMDSFAQGIKPGKRVKQGDIIGYVGATGERVTGPHVCLRLWKNEKQVNFIEEETGASSRLDKSELSTFMHYRDSLKIELERITYQ